MMTDTIERRHLEDRRSQESSTPDRRRGRKHKIAVTLDEVLQRARDPHERRRISVFDVAAITGFSKDKVYADIEEHQQLAADKVLCGCQFEYRISYQEAARYFASMGLI